ncbi:RNA polymerase, sigma-24 subunit, ECF subfamily [Sulfobacillus acidophilus DSM 10332]|uniref:RNA polymerase, sigma-24 subunit, ECF subfamily n=1 Tax=Sulfobacillus acidophilus (strain ATCC 700253 / DSM 10332 / NAL) TaxID=679936 RepID=G8TTJ4_SULAD|nr:RNA polymerase, sigma-24 subunit, ECF subfamily [Sulfobacillus acidophilus DSM 10332]
MGDTDQELLTRIAAGDQDAMMAFYDRYFGLVAGYCRKLIHDRMQADEVIQDVFWQVWKTACLYDAGRASATVWLMTIARSRAIDRLRRLAKETATVEWDAAGEAVTSSNNVEQAVVARSAQDALYDALDQLPDAQKAMIAAVYIRGQTAEQAARRQQIPVGTAKTRLRLGLEKLRRMVGVDAY